MPSRNPANITPCHEISWSRWWTGLDSNQRTLARADLQSAAFNHSATCPYRGVFSHTKSAGTSRFRAEKAVLWRRAACLSMARVAQAAATERVG